MTGMEQEQTNGDFNFNDPALLNYIPEGVEAEDGEPIEQVFPPPAEGAQFVFVTLRQQRSEDKPSVKLRQDPKVKGPKGLNVQANLVPRTIKIDEDGNKVPGDFLKDYYPNTTVQPGQTVSALGYVMKLAGAPFPAQQNFAQKIEHVKHVFEEAGEFGIKIPVFVQWLRQDQKLDKDGIPVEGSDGKAVYGPAIKGAKKIATLALKEAQKLAREESDEEAAAGIIARAEQFPFLYYSPIDGQEKAVQAQIARLVTPAEVEKAEAKRAAEAETAEVEAED